MEWLARAAEALGRFSLKWVPSSFSIAVSLTAVTAGVAFVATPAGLGGIAQAWGGGLWGLLAFAMRMALVMFGGYLLACAPPVARLLERIAGWPRTVRGAAVFVAVVSMGLGLLNWGLSIVGGALLVRFVAAREFQGKRADYPLLVACAYFGLGATWHAGLSASAPLIAATATEPLTIKYGVVAIDRTLLSGFNIGLVVATVVLPGLLAFLMHPDDAKTRPIDPALLSSMRAFEPPPREFGSFSNFIDHSAWVGWIAGAVGLGYAGWKLSGGVRALDIDLVNLVFISLAAVLHGRPASLVKASEEAAGVLGGIVLQFPLYAGIAGIFDKTGLATVIGDLFARVATQGSYPTVVYLYSGLVNYFVPSGGAKWAIEAPYILDAAQKLGVDPASVVLAYAWGDMATDLIQPFWALPLLAVAKLEFRDILGYLMIACAAYVGLVTVAFAVFR